MADYAEELLTGKASTGKKGGGGVNYAEELMAPNPALAGSVMQPIANKQSGDNTASFGTLVKSKMVDDPQTRLRIFAQARFPNLPVEQAVKRYAYVGDDVVYRGDDGKLYQENPPGVLGWLKENVGAGTVANTLPIVGSTIGGVLGVPGGPAGVAAGAGLGGAAGKGYNKVLANVAFDEPQSAGQNATDMAIEGGIDAATAGVGAKVGQMVATRSQAKDIAKLAPAVVKDLEAKAAKYGIQLTPAELTNLASLRAQQKTLSNLPQASDLVDEFLKKRAGQVQSGVGNLLETISPQDSAEVAARRGVETAGEAIGAASKARSEAAGPIYKRAFAETTGITEPEQMARALKLQNRLPTGLQEKALELARLEGVDLTQAQNTLQGMHYMKMALDDMIKEGDIQGMGNVKRRAVTNLKNEFVSLMDDISAKDEMGRSLYKQARDIYSHSSPAVEATKQGLTGKIAGKTDIQATRALDTLFGPKSSGPIAVAQARREIMGQDAESWNGMLRSYLQQRFEDAGKATANSATRPMQGAIFRSEMVGNKKQAEILKAAMSGDQWKAFNDLMDVLEATGRVKISGSDTAWNGEALKQMKAEAGGLMNNVVDPFGSPRRALEWLREVRLGNHAENLATIITSPNAMNRLKYLKQLSPNDQRFIAGVSSLLGSTAVPSSAQPIPQSLQQLPPEAQQ
jgi:hypothetical protein